MDFPLVAAEVEGFLNNAAAVGIDALFDLAGAVSSGIEGEVGLDLGWSKDLDAREVLKCGSAEVIERLQLAEGGPSVSAFAIGGDVACGVVGV